MLLLSTFFYSAGAAVAAFLALEAYLAVAAVDDTYPSVVLAAVAAAGQVTGKLLWYWAGAGPPACRGCAASWSRPGPPPP
ncbi:hypothetical protein [Promicromonospora aerolata]|uniref:Uncharacterized protein n=1 Tax=Promicromonospora aerolata TaxID=195749 RepID=A0ABW4VFR2_9MICO